MKKKRSTRWSYDRSKNNPTSENAQTSITQHQLNGSEKKKKKILSARVSKLFFLSWPFPLTQVMSTTLVMKFWTWVGLSSLLFIVSLFSFKPSLTPLHFLRRFTPAALEVPNFVLPLALVLLDLSRSSIQLSSYSLSRPWRRS